MNKEHNEEALEQSFYDWKLLPVPQQRKENTRTSWIIAFAMMALAIWLILSGCTSARMNRVYRSTPELREIIESWYICRENPENNRPGEQDSIKRIVYKSIKK